MRNVYSLLALPLFLLLAANACDKKKDPTPKEPKLNFAQVGNNETYTWTTVVGLRQGRVYQIIGQTYLQDSSRVELVIQFPGPNPTPGTQTISPGAIGEVAGHAFLTKVAKNNSSYEERRFGALGEKYQITVDTAGKVSIGFSNLSILNSSFEPIASGDKLTGTISEK